MRSILALFLIIGVFIPFQCCAPIPAKENT